MRKFKNICTVAIAVVAVVGSLLSATYTVKLSRRIEQVERSARADMVYLRGCIRHMEAELTAAVIDHLDEISRPVDGAEDTDTEPEPDETEQETEQVDLPTHNRPEGDLTEDTETESETETEIESESETETEAALLYTLAVHNERIGVFDATGRILCTLNVFVPSLPAADRSALRAGIPIYSQEQMWEILDKYA